MVDIGAALSASLKLASVSAINGVGAVLYLAASRSVDASISSRLFWLGYKRRLPAGIFGDGKRRIHNVRT